MKIILYAKYRIKFANGIHTYFHLYGIMIADFNRLQKRSNYFSTYVRSNYVSLIEIIKLIRALELI